jgi:integrase
LEAFLDAQEAEVSDSTLDARWRALNAWLKFLQKRGKLGTYPLPTAVVDRPKVDAKHPRVADWHAMQRMLKHIGNEHWLDLRDRCLIQLLMSTGLRINEAVNIRVMHVDSKDRFVYIETAKGGKARAVPYDPLFQQAFVNYVYNRPAWNGDDWLFLAANGHRRPVGSMTTNSARQVLRERCRAAGVAYQQPHSIRHMCAITWLNDEMPLSAVSAMLGHSSVSFTAKVYAKWVKSGLRRSYDKATQRADAGLAWRNA